MIDAMNSQKDADKILKRERNISERIVPNAIVYGMSGADELSRKHGRKDRWTRVQESFTKLSFSSSSFLCSVI